MKKIKKKQSKKNKNMAIRQIAGLVAILAVVFVFCGVWLFKSIESSNNKKDNSGQQGGLNVGDQGNDETVGTDPGASGNEGTQGGTGNEGTQGGTGNEGTQGGTGNEGTQGGTGNEGTQGGSGNSGNQGGSGYQDDEEGGRIF